MIHRWIRAIRRIFGLTVKYRFRKVDELPGKLLPETVYLEQHIGQPWRAAMTCPCGCGKILYLNLLRDYAPYWAYKTEGKIISLSPSVHRTVGCKSHFFITDGKLIWCR